MMKVTMHSGRGSARHNDHNGGTKRARWDKSRTKDNYVWTCMDSGGKHHSVEEGELAFYEHFYNRKLDKQNARYRSKGQYGYIRSMADWMKARQYQPNETILQIGNRDESVSDDVLWDAAVEFVNWKIKRYEGNYQCISMALHVDESTPHIHIRESWFSHDADGVPCPGIKAGLRELGIPLPDADRPEGKDNYRKATVDAECRSKWQEICKSRGLEIDTVPSRRNLGHMGLDAYKAYDDAMKQLEAEKAALEAERAAFEAEKAAHEAEYKAEMERFDAELTAYEVEMDEQNAEMDKIHAEAEELLRDIKIRSAALEQQEKELSIREQAIEAEVSLRVKKALERRMQADEMVQPIRQAVRNANRGHEFDDVIR